MYAQVSLLPESEVSAFLLAVSLGTVTVAYRFEMIVIGH